MWKKIIWRVLAPLLPAMIEAIGNALTKGDDPEEVEKAAKEAFFGN